MNHYCWEKNSVRIWLGSLHIEFNWWASFCFLQFNIGHDNESKAQLAIALPPLALWMAFPWPSWLVPRRLSQYLEKPIWLIEERGFRASIHDWTIRVALWERDGEWRSRDPWWIRGVSLDIPRALFGTMSHSEKEISKTQSIIPMAERAYPCNIVMKEETWRRARLPFASRKLLRAHIECQDGIPHPGKGENSWDCDDDATYSMVCPANTPEEGIARLIESTLRARRRYGGSINWQPKEAA